MQKVDSRAGRFRPGRRALKQRWRPNLQRWPVAPKTGRLAVCDPDLRDRLATPEDIKATLGMKLQAWREAYKEQRPDSSLPSPSRSGSGSRLVEPVSRRAPNSGSPPTGSPTSSASPTKGPVADDDSDTVWASNPGTVRPGRAPRHRPRREASRTVLDGRRRALGARTTRAAPRRFTSSTGFAADGRIEHSRTLVRPQRSPHGPPGRQPWLRAAAGENEKLDREGTTEGAPSNRPAPSPRDRPGRRKTTRSTRHRPRWNA